MRRWPHVPRLAAACFSESCMIWTVSRPSRSMLRPCTGQAMLESKHPRWKCLFSADKQCEIGRVITDFDVQAQATLLLLICLSGSIRDLVDALTVKTVTIMLLTNGIRLLGTMRCSVPGSPATTLSRPAWMRTKRGMGRSSMSFCPDWCNSGFSW